MQTKIVRMDNKTWRLPLVVPFYGSGSLRHSPFFYDVLGFRAPRRGEHYLSGAIIEVYKAANDLSTKFLVVEKTHKAKLEQKQTYVKA